MGLRILMLRAPITMLMAIGSSLKSNPSRRICALVKCAKLTLLTFEILRSCVITSSVLIPNPVTFTSGFPR